MKEKRKLTRAEVLQRQRTQSGRLTAEDVQAIKRALRDNTHTPRELASIYDVSLWTIRAIKRGDIWNWVTIELSPFDPIPPNPAVDAEAAKLLRKLQGDTVVISDRKADLESDLPTERQEALLKRLNADAKAQRKPLDDLQQFTEEDHK